MDTSENMSDPENTNCNATLDYWQLPAPNGMDGQEEFMCAESLYQPSCSQDQDQDGQLPAPDGMDVQDEIMCAESVYQTSCSQGQDQNDFPEDFSCSFVPTLLTDLEEEEMDYISTQTNICTEDTYTEDMYTGNICFLEEQEVRKSRKRKHSELCCVDDHDIEEPNNKVYVIDGQDPE